MTIEVELPDGSIVEFPDNTSPKTMEMALARYRQPAAPRTAPAANASPLAQLVSGRPQKPQKTFARNAIEQLVGAFSPQALFAPEFARNQVDALDALQHHGMNAVHGLAQLGEHGLAKVGLLSPDTVAADDRALAQREASYQAYQGNGPGGYIGAAVGEVAPWATGVGELRAAGLLPTVTATGLKGAAIKGGLLGLEGAAMGAATPVTEGDYAHEKAQQVGFGTVLAPVTHGLLKLPGAAASVVRPFTAAGREAAAGRQLAESFGGDSQALADLRAPGPAGYQPSAAQALKTPEAIQAERALRNNPDTAAAFARANAENNARLIAEAEGIAGTPAARKAAMDARAQATDPVFQQLESGRVDPLPALLTLDALERSSLGQGDRVSAAIAKLRSKIQSQVENGTINADVLSGIREQASSYLGPMATKQEKKALAPVRDSIVDALDAAIPGYRDTVATYGRLSQPLSDMEAGRALAESMRKGGLDALGGEAPSLNAVETILARDAKAKYPMSKAARARVEAIRDALKQRSVTNNTIAAQGNSATSAELTQLMQNLQGGLLERSLRSIPLAGPYIAEVPSLLRKDATRRAGLKAASAKATADAIEAAQRAKQRPQGLLSQYGMPGFLLPYLEQ